MWEHMSGWSGAMGGGWDALWMLLFWVLVIFAVVFLVKGFAGDRTARESGRNARRILEERYARGEIDKDELDQKRRDLAR